MTRLRLLPVLLVAATALLALKVVGLVTEGRYALTGTEFAVAQDQVDPLDEAAQIELSSDDEASAQRAADALFDDAAGVGDPQGQEPAILKADAQGNELPLEDVDESAVTERAVLERLSARRQVLDQLEAELTVRSDLVAAAEARLEERMAVLEDLEKRVSALMDQYDVMADEQFMGLVAMYENMKSKDAATVFNRLDINVLLRLATGMSSRKMAAVLADMDAQRAQELTIAMASLSLDEPAPQDVLPSDELPQIVGN